MKKLLYVAGLALSALFFAGCGGGGGGVAPGPGPGPAPGPTAVMWYIDDIDGVGVGGISYNCTSGNGVTDADGAFIFFPGDVCNFDFWGLPGNLVFSLHIDDELTTGVGNIPFECDSGWSGATYADGSFEYDADDYCTFYMP